MNMVETGTKYIKTGWMDENYLYTARGSTLLPTLFEQAGTINITWKMLYFILLNNFTISLKNENYLSAYKLKVYDL